MKWTKQAPTVPGFYLVRNLTDAWPMDKTMAIIERRHDELVVMSLGRSTSTVATFHRHGDEWAGPIPEPGEGGEG